MLYHRGYGPQHKEIFGSLCMGQLHAVKGFHWFGSPSFFWVIFIEIFFFNCIVSHYHSVSFYCPPLSVTTLLSVSMSPFSFLLHPPTPYSLQPPPHLAVLLPMSLSLFCLLVQFIRFCIWVRSYVVFLWLAYFTQHNVLQVHPCCHKGYNFPFYGWVVFHCVHVPVVLSIHLLMGTWAASVSWWL